MIKNHPIDKMKIKNHFIDKMMIKYHPTKDILH